MGMHSQNTGFYLADNAYCAILYYYEFGLNILNLSVLCIPYLMLYGISSTSITLYTDGNYVRHVYMCTSVRNVLKFT